MLEELQVVDAVLEVVQPAANLGHALNVLIHNLDDVVHLVVGALGGSHDAADAVDGCCAGSTIGSGEVLQIEKMPLAGLWRRAMRREHEGMAELGWGRRRRW